MNDKALENSTPVENLNFEQALGELEGIVRNLESGQAPLEASISSYERGILLKKHCEKKLSEARARIETINVSEDGIIQTAPLEQN